MLDAPLLAERLPSEPLPDPAADRAARHMARLEELAEIGMDIARSLQREAAAQAAAAEAAVRDGRMPAKGGKDIQLCFDRLTRAIRLTMALDMKLLQDGKEFAREAKAERVRREFDTEMIRRAKRRDRAFDVIERTIEAEVRHKGDAERLMDELGEQLEDAAEDFALSDRPVGAIIAEICQLMGLSPDWAQFEDEDWAVAEAGVEGSPFVERSRATQDPISQNPLIPAKAGTQMTKLSPEQGDHPDLSRHRIWAPAFAGVSGELLEEPDEDPQVAQPDTSDDQPP